jgi:hypothetical protein
MRMLKKTTAVVVLVAMSATLGAQAAVTAADLTRLEATVSEIEARGTALKASDPTLATIVDKSLNELKDEVTYLKVKMRREGTVPRADYTDVRDRLETLRIKSGVTAAAQPAGTDKAPAATPSEPRVMTIEVGTPLDVRLQTSLNSGTTKVEQRFEATTILDLKKGADVLLPAGTLMRGFVSSVRAAGKIERKGSVTLSFDELVLGNDHLRLRASITQALDGKVSEDATRIGAAAVLGAIVGGIIGGAKGAMVGVLVGGGGTIASTEGADVDLPLGTILRIRIDQPVTVIVGKGSFTP